MLQHTCPLCSNCLLTPISHISHTLTSGVHSTPDITSYIVLAGMLHLHVWTITEVLMNKILYKHNKAHASAVINNKGWFQLHAWFDVILVLCMQELAELRAHISLVGSQFATADDYQSGPSDVRSDSLSCACCFYRRTRHVGAYYRVDLSSLNLYTVTVAIKYV